MTNLEKEMVSALGLHMAREIDREVLWDMLIEIGWTRTMLPVLDSSEQYDVVIAWAKANCKKAFESSGRDYIFEDEQDAAWFVLKWSS